MCFEGRSVLAWFGLNAVKVLMKKILLADDDASIRQTLGQVLASEQYDVTFAASGRAAAARFMADLPDLVLLDLNLPDRDGWDVFELIKAFAP